MNQAQEIANKLVDFMAQYGITNNQALIDAVDELELLSDMIKLEQLYEQ